MTKFSLPIMTGTRTFFLKSCQWVIIQIKVLATIVNAFATEDGCTPRLTDSNLSVCSVETRKAQLHTARRMCSQSMCYFV